MIIDTHLHLIDRGVMTYPWLAGVPPLDQDFLYARYAAEAEAAGITDCLHMEVDVTGAQKQAEIDYARARSSEPQNRIRGAIAGCLPEEPGFAAFLETQLADPFVKGFRRVLHVMPDELSRSATFRENIRRLEGTRMSFDLCVLPHQIPIVAELVDLAPGVQFILDHCGNPPIKNWTEQPWRGNILELAKRPNVTAKISGVLANTDGGNWTVETLQPWIEYTIQAFGWDRVVWGGDWPVCNLGGGLTRWVEATNALLVGCSASERSRLLADNARRIWRL